ncbi:hypothetical protein B0H13DRAFT_1629259, partial [Mycena leptocephala]
LYRAAAGDATHDSEDRFPPPRCHPETRKKMLDVLWNRTSGTEPPKKSTFEDYQDEADSSSRNNPSSPVVWLHGPAGAGKSTIAQSLCQKLEKEGRLGASFFFKRGHASRGHAKRLFTTIAYQLALRLPDLKLRISHSVRIDPSLVDKSLSIQLQKLIVEPWHRSTFTRALVVIIDGLDECEDSNIQQEILRLIGRAVDEQELPLQFLVASRPEPHIRQIFMCALQMIHYPVNIEQSFDDVRKYLLDEFARIHREHRETMAMVPCLWPSLQTVDILVQKSSGYFIYASTVIKFIDDRDFRPTERLEVIMGLKESDFGSPFGALDQLYTQILSAVHVRPQLLKILTVIAAKISLPATYIEQLLELEPGDLLLALRGLHSVINIPAQEEDGRDPQSFDPTIVVHHASFRDFLLDPARAGRFYASGSRHRADLSGHILKAFMYMHDDPSLRRCGHVSQYIYSD